MAVIAYGGYRGQVLIIDGGAPRAFVVDPSTPDSQGARPRICDVPSAQAPLVGDLRMAAVAADRDGNFVFAGGATATGSSASKAFRIVISGMNFPPTFAAPPDWWNACLPGVVKGSPWQDVGDMSTPHSEPVLVTLCKGDLPAPAGLPGIPGSSQLVLGGSTTSGSSDGTEFWQALAPARAVPAGWRHSLVPNSGVVHTLPTPNETYVRQPPSNLPEVRLDSSPRSFQLANVVGGSTFVKNILVAFDMNTTLPAFAASNTAGSSWIVRLPYAGTVSQWEYWRGPSATIGVPRGDRLGGTAVLLHGQTVGPSTNGKNRVLAIGGAEELNNGSGAPNWATTSSVQEFRQNSDPAGGAWRTKTGPTPGRLWNSAVVLPDGKILILGGARTVQPNLTVTQPEDVPILYEPGTPGEQTGASATSMAAQPQDPTTGLPYPRLRGSMATLLPDGRVFLFGGEPLSGYPDSRATGEIFSPPYLACGERPIIEDVLPTDFDFGAPFQVVVHHSASNPVIKIVLIRPGAVTNGFSADNRYIELMFASTGMVGLQETFDVVAPADDLGPAGYYMLFVVQHTTTPGGCDVPSVAEFVRLK
ncbi:MAG: DUF1929 domain-containing protein [Cryobacterium sp.]|nr:DUF1929 domain-containing protein [Cryobacterium sp.]